jgi:hypothetical protein
MFSSLRAPHLAPLLRHRRALFRRCSAARRRVSSTVSRPSLCASGFPSTGVLILVQANAVPLASRPPGCRRGHLNADSHDRPWICPAVTSARPTSAPSCSPTHGTAPSASSAGWRRRAPPPRRHRRRGLFSVSPHSPRRLKSVSHRPFML